MDAAKHIAAEQETAAGLSQRDREILEFERHCGSTPVPRSRPSAEKFDMSSTRYYQVLNALIDRPEALEADRCSCRRLRRCVPRASASAPPAASASTSDTARSDHHSRSVPSPRPPSPARAAPPAVLVTRAGRRFPSLSSCSRDRRRDGLDHLLRHARRGADRASRRHRDDRQRRPVAERRADADHGPAPEAEAPGQAWGGLRRGVQQLRIKASPRARPPRPPGRVGRRGRGQLVRRHPTTTVYFPPRLKAAGKQLALDLGIKRTSPAVGVMKRDRLTVILTTDAPR